MPLTSYFEEIKVWTEETLHRLVPHAHTHPARLHEAMRYSLFAGGKRLRPMLAAAACDAVGGNRDTVAPFAAALEMIHTYTLIHDDLPALDDDELRRGRPTCHVRFDEATAILAGDGLLTMAAQFLTKADLYPGVDPAVLLRVATETLFAIGSQGTIGGQVVDIEMENKAPDLAALEYIHTHKTGTLIVASVRGGALLAGSDDDRLEALTEYARAIGLAFQIVDDILDETGDAAALGKTPGVDKALGKLTYPAAIGMDESKKLAARLADRAIGSLAPFGATGSRLADIARYIVARSF
ncbi:MAG: polyprenyl synthetase family protein [Nitrospinae bacterium]|nr:polyprenyl synthetase family protein [Nitrospinota bacterium]